MKKNINLMCNHGSPRGMYGRQLPTSKLQNQWTNISKTFSSRNYTMSLIYCMKLTWHVNSFCLWWLESLETSINGYIPTRISGICNNWKGKKVEETCKAGLLWFYIRISIIASFLSFVVNYLFIFIF